MFGIVVAVAVAAAPPPTDPLLEAAHAMSAGRLDQAKTMVANAVASGASKASVEGLLADLAFRSGRTAEALARYEALLAQNPKNLLVAESAGIAALKLRLTDRATELLMRSTASPATSWRGWNGLGVIADLRQDWTASDAAYEQAARRSPDQAEIYNNMGWSKLLRGDWPNALPLLFRAAQLDPKSARIAANLELAQTAIDEDLPRRRPRESDVDWAARLNDAGVLAQISGDKARSIAAFTQAIEARDIWYARAANNLRLAQAPQ